MSFWSALGHGLLGAIPVVGPALSEASSVLGKQRQSAAAGREAEGNAQQAQDRNAIGLYQAQQNAQNQAANTDLERKKYTDTARGTNASRAVIANLLGSGLPHSTVSVAGVPQASMGKGMLDALANNPQALSALQTLASQSSDALTSPAPFAGGDLLKAPSLTPLPQESAGGGFLDALANIGQIVGSASPFIKRRQPNGGMNIEDYGG